MENNKSKYLELVEFITKKIEENELQPGEKIYSENQLSSMFGISRQTVRHAISILVNEKLLIRIQGSGTYVNEVDKKDTVQSTRIAVITTYVDNYIFPKIIQGIEKVLSENGYAVQISFTNNEIDKERDVLEDILNKSDVAGIICETTMSGLPNPNMKLYRDIQKRKIPILFINSYYAELQAPHVSINDKLTAKDAMQYIIQKGHKKIGGIFKLDDGQGHLRYLGYIEAMKENGLQPCEDNIVWLDTRDIKQLECCKDRIMDRIQGCSAIFCYNDEVAFGITKIMAKENMKIPEDMSIISIDNSELTTIGEIAITSMEHPKEKLGEKAAENLCKLIRNKKYNATYEFETKLIERSSVRVIDRHC